MNNILRWSALCSVIFMTTLIFILVIVDDGDHVFSPEMLNLLVITGIIFASLMILLPLYLWVTDELPTFKFRED